MLRHQIGLGAGGIITALVLLMPASAQEKQGKLSNPAPKQEKQNNPPAKQENLSSVAPMVNWDLKLLNQEPFKLIKATPNPKNGTVRFLIEFSRNPTNNEIYDWRQGDGMAVFRFLDEDGVAIKTVKPKLEGELIPKAGTRVRLLLPMPDAKIQEATWKIVAD